MDDIIGAIFKLAIGLVIVLLMFRFLRKELAQVTPIDLLFILILGELFGGIAHTPDIPFWHILVVVPVWGVLIWLLEQFNRSRKFQRLVEGKPKLLIKDGVIIKEVMEKERLNEDEIKMKLRYKGIFDINEVEKAILETSGDITAKRFDDK